MNAVLSAKRCVRGAFAATALAVLLPGQARAEDELDLSRDGRTWTSTIDAPLFDEAMRWVPGDSETAQFYVRGRGGTAGDLTVDVISTPSDQLLESGDLRITARGGGGAWTPVVEGGTQRLLSTPSIADGAVVPVTVTATFDAAATNMTELRATRLKFRVSLTESIPDSGTTTPGHEPEAARGTLLPDAGGPALWWTAAGVALAGLGGLIVSRRDVQSNQHGTEFSDV